jgi:hypothetical protein
MVETSSCGRVDDIGGVGDADDAAVRMSARRTAAVD